MVARIAPSPIATAVAIGDAHTHAADHLPSAPLASDPQQDGTFFASDDGRTAQADAPPLPAPPGEAFAAAVIAGQLPPRPVTHDQLRQRLGAAWQPPSSPFRLMDRTA